MNEFFRRIRYLMNRRRFDQELARDMEFHREMAAREGRSPLPNQLLLREQSRDAWGWTWIDRLAQDLRYAARMLRNSPGFTLAAVLMLALGIGVNVALFGFFDLMVLRPLPVRDPATLLQFERSSPGNFADNFPYPEVMFFREHSTTLSAVLAINYSRLSLNSEAQQINAHFVTANFFSELGAAGFGRMLDPARDEAADANPVVVLGQGFWQRHFGGDPSVVGRIIRLNGKPATVIGVASRQFSGFGLGPPDLWAPIAQRHYFINGDINVQMWGRLQPGLAPRVAEQELKSLAAELRKRLPADVWEKESLPSHPGGYPMRLRNELVPILALVAALCLLILAVACGNLGSLLLARGVAREREIAIRVAVGAGRGRLMRQWFTESLLLALLGSAAGLAMGSLVLRSIVALAALPEWLNPAPDWRVLLFAICIGFAAAVMFGLTPALHTARQRHRTTITRQFLIGAQVAASCVLLIVAGLLVRALDRALHANPGFDYAHVISIDARLEGYSPAGAQAYFDALEARVRALPGVASVSLASNPPLGNRWTVVKADVAGRTADIHFNNIDSSFFETMQIPLLRGRTFAPGDTHAIIVGESLARLQWPGEDPLGKSFRTGAGNQTVVGISGSARLVSPEDSDAVEVYQLAGTSLMPSMVVLVRTTGPSESLLPLVASIARAIDPKLFPEAQLMKTAFRGYQQTAGYSALAVGLLGSLALLLACIGIVGLVAYAVSQRTKEIGIRMALGARPMNILAVVLRRFSYPVAAGLLVGIIGAAALSQILRRELYGVSSLDPLAYLAAMAVFVVTVVVAALLPARRALRIDPMRALRYE
jgi:predicted permease